MSIKVQTFPEIEKDVLSGAYNQVALCDKNGKVLLSFNHRGMKLEDRLTGIKKRLSSSATAPGVYQIHAKEWNDKAVPGIYYVGVGNESEYMKSISLADHLPAATKKEPITISDHGVTYEKYNDLYLESLNKDSTITQLRAEILGLENRIDDLENEISELSDEENLADPKPHFIESLAESAMPLLDKFLEQRDRKLKLDEAKYFEHVQAKTNPKRFTAAKNEEEEEEEMEGDLTDEEEYQLNALAILKNENPEEYNKIMGSLVAANKSDDGEND